MIGGPLLIAPALYLASQFLDPVALAGFVLGAVSTGHHLPGFVRAYSDPVLFERYRIRFVLFPPLLFAAVFWFTWNDMYGAMLIVGTWGMWHGFMQLYGFMRIYAAKRGESSPHAARLDWLLCSVGFLSILIWSVSASSRITDAAEGAGLFFVPLLFGPTARAAAALAFGAIVVVYVGFTLHRWRSGHAVAPLKLMLIALSLLFLYGSWVLAGTAVLLGLAAWELFHDTQYLAIAWASNRRLAEKPGAGRLLRQLYRSGPARVALYVATCLLYGAFANAQGFTPSRAVGAALFSLVLTSALLHFYFDGFIWKVSQAKTRDDLGLPGTGAPTTETVRGATGRRDLLHLVLFALPFGLLAVTGLHREALEIPMRSALVAWLPGDAGQQFELAAAYQERGRLEAAEIAYRKALEAEPSWAVAHHNLARVLVGQGRPDAAEREYRAALAANPKLKQSAEALANWLVASQRPGEAVGVARAGLAEHPDDPGLQSALARALLANSPDAAGVAEAVEQARQAVAQTGFDRANPLVTLANALAAQQRFNRAIVLLERAQRMEEVRRNPALARRVDADLRRYRAVLR